MISRSKPGNKYHARRINRGGMWFASIKEADRYFELSMLQRAGKISELRTQVPYELIPAQYEEIPTGTYYVRGERKGQEKVKRVCVEQSVCYVADFVYTEDGRQIVEDTKGVRTADYIIKRKLMLHKYGIKIREV